MPNEIAFIARVVSACCFRRSPRLSPKLHRRSIRRFVKRSHLALLAIVRHLAFGLLGHVGFERPVFLAPLLVSRRQQVAVGVFGRVLRAMQLRRFCIRRLGKRQSLGLGLR